MMTIKDFAALCGCNAQTLRYYDRIGLLCPARVDEWTGYRYYEDRQAVDFVKIKNLQLAEFTIEEIKDLLQKSDEEVYAAFDEKIAGICASIDADYAEIARLEAEKEKIGVEDLEVEVVEAAVVDEEFEITEEDEEMLQNL